MSCHNGLFSAVYLIVKFLKNLVCPFRWQLFSHYKKATLRPLHTYIIRRVEQQQQQHHLPMQGFPLTALKTWSHVAFFRPLFGQIQPNIGERRNCDQALLHDCLKKEKKKNNQCNDINQRRYRVIQMKNCQKKNWFHEKKYFQKNLC